MTRLTRALAVSLAFALAIVLAPTSSANAVQVGFVTGTVYTEDHPTQGLYGVYVYLVGADGTHYFGNTQTGDDGTYSVSAVAGTYSVHFFTSDGPYEGQWWENAQDFDHATPVTVVVGAPVTAVDATLQLRGSVSGSSYLQGTSSSSGGYVQLINCNGGPYYSVPSTATTAGTSFTVPNVAAGKYVLGWNKGSSSGIVPGWWDNTPNESDAVPFVIGPGQNLTGKDLHSQVAASIYGRVTSTLSTQPEHGVGAGLALYDLNGEYVANTRSLGTGGGYFSIGDLRAGQYKIRVTPTMSPTMHSAWWGGGTSFETAGTATVAYNQDNELNIEVDAASSISGTVRDSGGNPVASVAVTGWSTDYADLDLRTITDSQGRYTLYAVTGSAFTLAASDSQDAARHERPASTTIEPEYWPSASSLWQATSVIIPHVGDQIIGKDFVVTAAGSLPNIPSPTSAPTISGDVELGSTLTANPGSQWNDISGLTFSYQWQRDGRDIPGVNGATYSLTSDDLYHQLSVVVSATKPGYTWQHAESADTAPVADPLATGYFADVRSTNVFFDNINWMASSGVSTGTANPPGSPLYKPVDPISRQAFAAFLYRYSGETFTPPEYPTFRDISSGDHFYTAIEWMAAKGISTGTVQSCGLPLFKPVSPISRQAVAAFLARYANADLSSPGPQAFADVPITAPFAAAIGWMSAEGISTGTAQPEGQPLYKPLESVSRQAVAAFLARYDALP